MGVVYSTLAAMQLMSKEHGGNGGIIGIVASVASLTPFWCIPIYTATKHAILGFIRCLSVIIFNFNIFIIVLHYRFGILTN